MTKYITETECAELTGLSLSTLRNDRSKRVKLPYIKVGKSVRYDQDDIVKFMDSHKIKVMSC